MTSTETAWQASIDYAALMDAKDIKARLAKGRGARSAIRAAGYLHTVTCAKREDALGIAQEITEASGVPMRVDEIVLFSCFA